jgi:putative membrane-bound dehydrogenase-like protein
MIDSAGRTIMGFIRLAILVVLCGGVLPCAAAEPPSPRVLDDRLQLTLVASDPDVATPVGLAIDGRGRLFVLESHTHSPPKDYAGPHSDRVKVFDVEGRGRAQPAVFAEGLDDAMSLAFGPSGDLYVVTSRAVYALHDRDGDDRCEARTRILELLTPERPYEHAALLGIAVSHDGWLYVSRGNTGGIRYALEGADGSRVRNFGDGGNIVRCRPDGSLLEEVATGFWNPLGIAFDRFGRLVCADNDPDARGPNRLVHVIPGGDYGYKSMYGGGGNHPFQCWNGEIPGTLPFAAGLGEAPCSVIDAAAAGLGPDYADSLLVSVWGQHNITRCRRKPRGVSFTADTEILVQGDQSFRPTAIAADPRGGALYVCDWMLRDYPSHGKGRVWRLSGKPGAQTTRPRRAFDPPIEDPGVRRLAALAGANDYSRLEAALSKDDPFERAAAISSLARPAFRKDVLAAAGHRDADVRLGALLALRKAGVDDDDASPRVQRALGDPDPRVRQVALIWAGERGLEAARHRLAAAIAAPGTTAVLFETYLAASECLSPEFVKAVREGKATSVKKLPARRLDPGVVEAIVRNESAPAALRALALTRLANPDGGENFDLLRRLIDVDRPDAATRLRVEAIGTLAASRDKRVPDVLFAVARNADHPPDIRAEAILALAQQAQAGEFAAAALPLLDDPQSAVRVEVARYLKAHVSDDARVRSVMADKLKALEGTQRDPRLVEQLRFALGEADPQRPASPEQWQQVLAEGGAPPGDPGSGARVFQSPRAACSRCHTVHNRGGRIGPDLSGIGRSLDRANLIRAILRPSDQYSIDYQAWFVKTTDGDTHLGLQLDLKDKGAIELFTLDGRTAHFPGTDVAGYGALEQSIMPAGLEAGMSVSDFRDLIAFLETLKQGA